MKLAKKVLIGVGILVLACAAAGLVYAWPMFFMKPAPTGPLAGSEVYAANTGMNSVYLVPLDEGILAIDTGASAAKLEKELAAFGYSPSEVRYVLFTHCDYDHIAGRALFPQAQFYLSEGTFQMAFTYSAPARESLPEVPLDRVTVVADGETLTLGGQAVACIALPGHTPGSMAYLIDGVLFTGDAVKISGGEMQEHPYTMDNATLEENIEKIRGAQAEWIATAHYGVHSKEDLSERQN